MTRSVSGASASAGPFQSASAASNSGMARPRPPRGPPSPATGTVRVDEILVEFEQVPVPAPGQRGARERLEQLPQPGHQGLQAGARGPGRLCLPDGVDDSGDRHDLTDPQRHQAQDQA